MPETTQPRKTEFTGDQIVQDVDGFRRALWARWRKERLLTSFYNADKTYREPGDGEVDDQDIPESFGLGNRFIRKPFDQLCDSILDDPGFVKTDLQYPLQAQRKPYVEACFDREINRVVHARMETVIKGLAGRALITGKSFAFRLSRWDWLWKQGRMLHDPKAPNSIEDDTFREWAFMGNLTLRDIDGYIDKTRDYDGSGWSKTGLRRLKRWILETTDYEKNNQISTVSDSMLELPFDSYRQRQNLEVYWYFRKNGRLNPMGQERVDLYCVSRWMGVATIAARETDTQIIRSLSINYDQTGDKNQQIIYYLPDAFESVSECLITCMLDDRIDGEQTMIAMEGLGRLMVNRILPMEHLTGSMISGLSWAVQPNFQAQSGADQAEMERLAQEGGVGPWDGIPSAMKMVDKNNSLTGLSSAMQVLQMLGMSAEQDAATGEIGAQSVNQPQLKAVAEQWINQTNAQVGRRKAKFFSSIDKISASMVDTFGRPFTLWRKGDPGYYDVLNVQIAMIQVHKVSPAEFSSERMTGKARRLSGDADKAGTVQRNIVFGQTYGGQMAPEGIRFLAHDSARATFGDSLADMMFPTQPQVPVDQQIVATAQESMCIVSLQIPQRNPGDDPVVHSIHHMQAISMHIQAAQQAGSWTPKDRMGVMNLFQHMTMDVPGMPVQQRQEMEQALQGMARVAASIEVTGAMSATQLKEMDAQRKNAELQLRMEHEHNLVDERKIKNDMNQQKIFLAAEGQSQSAKTQGVNRAATLLQMAKPPETTAEQ